MSTGHAKPSVPADGHLPPTPIELALVALGFDSSVEDRLSLVWRVYQEETGETIGAPPTDGERKRVITWLIDNCSMLYGKRLLLTPFLHQTMTTKASSLTQLGCRSCESRPPEGTPFSVAFPIGIEPWSAQSKRDKVAIRKAVNDSLIAQGIHHMPWGESALCVSITAVVSRRRKLGRKDVDNLAKGILDAMNGYLYRDDELIQCLTLRRIEYAGDQGIYLVRAMPVADWVDDVIFDDPRPPKLASGIVDYRP